MEHEIADVKARFGVRTKTRFHSTRIRVGGRCPRSRRGPSSHDRGLDRVSRVGVSAKSLGTDPVADMLSVGTVPRDLEISSRFTAAMNYGAVRFTQGNDGTIDVAESMRVEQRGVIRLRVRQAGSSPSGP